MNVKKMIKLYEEMIEISIYESDRKRLQKDLDELKEFSKLGFCFFRRFPTGEWNHDLIVSIISLCISITALIVTIIKLILRTR